MPSVQRLFNEGSRRGERTLIALADEFRDKRVAVGLSQQAVADAAGISRSSYVRIERGRMSNLSIIGAARVSAVLGLDLSVRTYPGANSLRDAAHGARLGRVLVHVGAPLSYGLEVVLPRNENHPYEQRAWDALVTGHDKRTAFEMEMRIRDAQALERRIALKRRDDPVDSLVVLVADTKHNRQVVHDSPWLFVGLTRLTFRELTRLLQAGQHPPSALVFV